MIETIQKMTLVETGSYMCVRYA